MVPDVGDWLGRLRRSPAFRAWIAARVVVLLALVSVLATHPQTHASLGAWDGRWYRDIAERGYLDAPSGAVRFFPIWPLIGRVAHLASGLSTTVVLVCLANAAAAIYLSLARRLADSEGLGVAADRVPAVVALAPAGAVLVMSYTEALFGVLLCIVLQGARSRRWWACALAGVVAGALRPTGVVLGLPVLIEAVQGWRTATAGERSSRLAATLAPGVGLLGYLGWAWLTFGDPLEPYRAQIDPALRGAAFVDPLRTVESVGSLHGNALIGVLLNGTAVVVAVSLTIIGRRTVPASFTAFSVATIFLGVTARSFSSFERYACSALPLLLVAATLLSHNARTVRWAASGAMALLFAQSVLTFAGVYLP